ncbi:MAG TPA: T9SS type A sorting domain-containing protein [Flavobacteriales bacterium]|nr:T9SS type A sorting domain-containing protein [Flavobacteriales bacterium]
MKKLFILLVGIGLSISSYSTHLMGGQITASYISSDSNGSYYIVELDVYRDTLGIPMNLSQQLDIYILDSSFNYQYVSSPTISFGVGGPLSSMSSVYGVEIYHFVDTITFATNGNYVIKWTDCCRNGAIINMSAPLSESMSFATILTVDSANPNSSPTFLAGPVTYLPTNTLWQYNPLPFDPDGDSLAWSMSVPYSGGVNAIPDTVSGYEYLDDTTYSNATAPFSIDPITGQITWSAKLVGNFVVSFAIHEYRNGTLIGIMNRDMQFVVIPDTNNAMPMISNINNIPTNSLGYPYVKINPGQNYQLHLLASDADINDVVSMQAFGEPFNQIVSPSSFSVTPTGNGNEIDGEFSWTPDIADVRTTPYLVVFRTSDNQFYYDETVQFEVTLSSTALENINGMEVSDIYPNPANNRLFIPISLDKSDNISIEIYNMIGVKLSVNNMNLSTGNHMIMKDIDLNSGQYIVVIRDKDGISINTQQLIIVK